ncbi:Similar to Mettl25: Methyltransferase-like protein 25 (Mus musculus) [Cotesia congregata]|uniref:Similar to Mettl25: Methyltransferase-like protein 25 (Mus musculus) n=1 Tax=Cotesia congregata TaxID=51543 RepID=A0A8J2HAH6_COTCN|nr:Similar to Mettl25: Methyltransferase-like protein 25 (Mus musculus) [Cotesia congregata]
MDCYDELFVEILSFIDKYEDLINCHLVDFITDNLWEKCLPGALKSELEDLEKINYNLTVYSHINENCELKNFIEKINYLNLKNNPHLLKLEDLSVLSDNKFSWNEFCNKNNDNNNKIKQNFMKDKKNYEIEVLTKVIGYLSKINSSLVIDVGAGKGYLGTSLYENYKIPVVAIDSCESRHKSAISRQKLLLKKTHKSYPLVQHSINYINESTDYSELINSALPDYNGQDNYLLAGLHTCGSLAGAMIKGFLNSPSLKTLCVVSCCYHLTEECLTKNCKFTTNARMLAQQSVERMSKKSKQYSPSLFYRSLLQKIGLEQNQIPSTEDLEKLHRAYADREWKMNAFQYLRVHLASLIESALVLDRVIYLQKSGKCSKASVVRLFDPLLSPRCYAIIALK